MTDLEMLELCKQHFAFLGKAAEQKYLRDVKTRKLIGAKVVIRDECIAAMARIDAHLKENKPPETT